MTTIQCPGCKAAIDGEGGKSCPECGWVIGKSLFGQHSDIALKAVTTTAIQRYKTSRISRLTDPVAAAGRSGIKLLRHWLRVYMSGRWLVLGLALAVATYGFHYGLQWTGTAIGCGLALILLPLIWYWANWKSLEKRNGVNDMLAWMFVLMVALAGMGQPIELPSPFGDRGIDRDKRPRQHDSRALMDYLEKAKQSRPPEEPDKQPNQQQRTAKATEEYWRKNVAELHEMRYGEINDEIFKELLGGIKAQIFQADFFSSTDQVDLELVEMCRRHLEIDKAMVKLINERIRKLEEEGAPIPHELVGTAAERSFAKFANMSDEEWEQLPADDRDYINSWLDLHDQSVTRMLEIKRMQGVLSERYKSEGVEFPLPELVENDSHPRQGVPN